MAEVNKVLLHASRAIEFLSDGRLLTAPELAHALDIPRPSGYRLQRALVEAGFAAEHSDGSIRISTRWLTLGDQALDAISARFHADELLLRLREQTDLTVFLCVLRGESAVCIRQLHGENFQVLALKVGGELPLYMGAVGRVLLAYGLEDPEIFLKHAPFPEVTPYTLTTSESLRADVEQTRSQGYCLSDQDVTIGVAAFGVPVLGPDGETLAALSVAGLRDEVVEGQERLLGPLRDIAARIADRTERGV